MRIPDEELARNVTDIALRDTCVHIIIRIERKQTFNYSLGALGEVVKLVIVT